MKIGEKVNRIKTIQLPFTRVSVGLLKHGTDLITDNAHMAEILNNQFSSVFKNEDLTNIPHSPDTSGGNYS